MMYLWTFVSWRSVACFVGLFIIVTATISTQNENEKRVFEVDYSNDQFLKDGKPFQYVSGSLHYFRVPRAYWRDRLRKLRAAGLNAVSTYIEWSQHEPWPGVYDFTGDNDIEHFIKLAEEEGLLVIVRPGPYVCAERDLGGYPVWLLHKKHDMILRTNDSVHNQYVRQWFGVLMPKLQPFLYGNGGPVIMVQVENEYGSYIKCDRDYLMWLRDLYRSYVGSKALLFTTDGAYKYFLKCGPIPGIFITVDFGSGSKVPEVFDDLRKIQAHGPLVNSEFYPGWLTHWGENVSRQTTPSLVNTTRALLTANASFNYYMFFGGTNFAFSSGANYDGKSFLPQITSYDYDAPISEAGDLTDKYFAIKSVISEFLPIKDIEVKNGSKMSYGTLLLEPKMSLLDSDTGIIYKSSKYPMTFEELNQKSGLVMYEASLPSQYTAAGYILQAQFHDWALVFEDKVSVGVLSRIDNVNTIIIGRNGGKSLNVLVENQGHINYKNMSDFKGLFNLTLDGEILTDWKHTGYTLDNVSSIATLPKASSVYLPAFYSTQFQLPETLDEPQDTFVDMTGWSKGVLYVNNFNLGRYWPAKGPQVTYYLPGPYLRKYPEYNIITILELLKENPSKTVNLVTDPVWATISN